MHLDFRKPKFRRFGIEKKANHEKAAFFVGQRFDKEESAYKSLEQKMTLLRNRKCFVCEEKGHITRDCPHRKKGEHEDKKADPSAKKFDPKKEKTKSFRRFDAGCCGRERQR